MKKYVAMALCLLMCLCSAFVAVSAADVSRDVSTEETLASRLKELGLFKGVSETNFDLKRAPTRIEALVMLIRVLGKEKEALSGTWCHPFTDVPEWANAYVGYAYDNGLTNGVSQTKFGNGDAASFTYLTFMLRALGYSDMNNADFVWNNPYDLAKSIGIMTERVDSVTFLRADAVTISYAALSVNLKGTEQTLAEKLIGAGLFTAEAYVEHYIDLNGTTETPALPPVMKQALDAQQIAKKCSSAVFYIDIYSYNGKLAGTGSGFFISADGLAITNFHVAANSSALVITTSDGTVYTDVTVIDAYKEQDLALLRVKGEAFSYLEIGDSTALQQGQTVYAIGSPRGLDNTMSQGIISNIQRVIGGTEYVQISVPIAPGSSGGALINEYGEVVGVTSAGLMTSTGDLNLAVPIRFAKELDFSATSTEYLFNDSFYPGFEQVYDFGAFSGVRLIDQTSTPLSYVLTYDARDFVASPKQGPGDNYGMLVILYMLALEYQGMVCTGGTDLRVASFESRTYESATEKVVFSVDLEKTGLFTIQAERKPQYYADFPQVPDIGWFFGVPIAEIDIGDDGSTIYTYSFSPVNGSDMLKRYFEWVDSEKCIRTVSEKRDDCLIESYLFENCSVVYFIKENALYVSIIQTEELAISKPKIKYSFSREQVDVAVGEAAYVTLMIDMSALPADVYVTYYLSTILESIAESTWVAPNTPVPWEICVRGLAEGTTFLMITNDYNDQVFLLTVNVSA